MDFSDQLKSQNQDVIDIGQYVRILKRRKWSIAFITLIFIALAIVYIFKATQYQTQPNMVSMSLDQEYFLMMRRRLK